MRRVVFAVLLLAACHAKEEARMVVTAIDAYRAASNDDKPARADALDKVPCTDDQVCAVKAVCTKSADATAKGLRLQQEIQSAVKDGGADRTEMENKWKEANNNLAMGYGLLEDCRTKTQALRERYGI
jgi:hypothetical protein